MNRTRWQYCQIEVNGENEGLLRQFFPDRPSVDHNLRDNWPAMIGKLGEQGWELVSVLPNEGGRGRNPLTYVFKRSTSVPLPQGQQSAAPQQSGSPQVVQSTAWQNQPPLDDEDEEDPEDPSPLSGFEPLRGQ